MQVNGLADGNAVFLATAGENWSHLATSHGTQSACGASPVAEGIGGLCLVGGKCGDMWGQEFGFFFWRKAMYSALNLRLLLDSHLMVLPSALTNGSC